VRADGPPLGDACPGTTRAIYIYDITNTKLQRKKEREREANRQLVLSGIKQLGYNKRTLVQLEMRQNERAKHERNHANKVKAARER
jgi:hypothetical protein